jgi:hypothetical protein
VYPDIARPLGINTAAALAARAALPHGGQVLIGGRQWDVEVLRFSIGHDLRPRVFDDCGDVPLVNPAIYVLNSEHAPAASALSAAGAPLLARVPRLDDAFLVYGEPPGTIPSPPAGPCR